MKWFISIFFILFYFQTNVEAAFRVSLLTSISSKQINAEDSVGEDGTLISNGNFTYGLGFSYGLSQSWHVLLGHESKTYAFDNTEKVIAEDESISVGMSYIGLRWILFTRTSLRFLINSEENIGYEVNSDGKAILYKEGLNYMSLYYDQIVYLGVSLFAGFKVGYEMTSSSTLIEERSASKYGVFMTLNTSGWGQVEAYYEFRNITKSDENLNFVENDANLNLTYTVGF